MTGSSGGGGKKVLANIWALVKLSVANVSILEVASTILSAGIWVLEKSIGSPLIYLLAVYMSLVCAFSNHFDQCFFLESSTHWLNFRAASLCSAWVG